MSDEYRFKTKVDTALSKMNEYCIALLEDTKNSDVADLIDNIISGCQKIVAKECKTEGNFKAINVDKLISDIAFCPDWKFTRQGVIDIIKECMEVNFYDFSFECSECKKEIPFKYHYCPNCGAEMRGEEDEVND